MKREYVEKIQKAAKEHFLQKTKKFLLENRDDLSRMTTPDFVKKFEQEMLS